MERKYLKDLIEWMNDEDKKPLLVTGARQVGKTYLIKDIFAETYYKDKYLRIDCSVDEEFVNYVYNNNNLKKVIDFITVNYNFTLDKDHLLIIDEAQECLPVIKMMKHFCEQRRDIPLIVTGSLVRIKIQRETRKRGGFAQNKSFLFPVGKINQIYIYPMTFDEFLQNYNQNAFNYLNEHFEKKITIDSDMHKKFIDIFNEYLLVGGMPEVVDVYLKNNDNKLQALKKAYSKIKEIYDDYLDDMQLYQASPESIIRSRLIYQDIFKQLNKENKNFKFSEVEAGSKGRDMINPIGWLTTANIVYQSFLLKEKISTPLIKDNNSLTRLYLSDMGMFTYQSGLNATSFITSKDNTLSGIYYENYVAIELVSRDIKLFYWKGKRDSELEFIINVDDNIIPIDAKKKKGTLSSLEEFRNHNKRNIVIKISENQYGYNEDNMILTIPYYYLSFYLNEIKNNRISD